ncbi:uncharacterized protein LOC131806001 [Musca domestica]|uniref:Uncharacterized protein LOC131806001 n=1 Tax=Musca domestica TaxID=7370 RepID=A0ABM3VJ86_MUSDO|nr:uncharacterized protein LOC131806001 [Musca domestica]
MEEFLLVLKNKKKPSAAGPDGITYEMINHLSDSAKTNFFEALNYSWKKCEIRDEWRKIKIVPIPKKGKDLELFTNFRPIALISVPFKIINLMVKERLQQFIDEENILPTNTFAYRKHLSTSMCINNLLYTINYYKSKGEKVIILSLDVEKAYDCVRIEMLLKILCEINCPTDIADWIINFLSKRTIVMGNESIEIYNGLPQGSCLSPLPFNIYTLGLHGISDENTHLFQFADDFVLLSAHKHFELANQNLQQKAIELQFLLSRLNLTYNTNKTSVMYIAKGPRKIPSIALQGTQITPVSSIKFLGRHIKNSLSLKEHYEEVIHSCNSSLNAIKMINNLKHGLLPNISINLAKSLVFSKTEYCISSMAHMPTYLNKKLTTFQNQMLRRSLGLTPSTPVQAIYALAVMLPPEQRSQYLTAKELIKFKCHNRQLYQNITNNPTNKTSLGLIYMKFKHIFDETIVNQREYPSSKFTFFLNLFNSTKNTQPNEFYRVILQEKTERLQNTGHTIWATDASISSTTTGCAICNISKNQNFLFKIPAKMSSLMGELHAINKAIDIMIEDNIRKATILTDSKNACLILKQNDTQNYLANNILQKVNNSSLTQLTIIWIPSHIGIAANERADFFAKHAAEVGSIIQTGLSIKDARSLIHQHLWSEWKENYKHISISKGTYFSQFFPEPPNRHWFSGFNMSPGEIKVINRLLTGHTYGKTYLSLINAENSNLCEICNTPNTENHQIFICPKYNNDRMNYNFFTKFSNLPAVLKSFACENFRELCDFIHKNHIQL